MKWGLILEQKVLFIWWLDTSQLIVASNSERSFLIWWSFSYLGCVWLREESVKREISMIEYEKREIDEKYDGFDVLFGIKERWEKLMKK